jgi:hypothetical protein
VVSWEQSYSSGFYSVVGACSLGPVRSFAGAYRSVLNACVNCELTIPLDPQSSDEGDRAGR